MMIDEYVNLRSDAKINIKSVYLPVRTIKRREDFSWFSPKSSRTDFQRFEGASGSPCDQNLLK